jgi:hypothetical protein
MSFPLELKSGDCVDLKGQRIVLPRSLVAPPGVVTVENGTIVFSGNGGKVGSGGMACFETRPNTGTLTLKNLRVEIPPKAAVVQVSGGSVICQNITQTGGALTYCEGGESVTIQSCASLGRPDKYWFINATNLLKKLRIDNTGVSQPILQGNNEAAVRLMQVDDAEIIGLKVKGSGCKQAVQDRPGGRPGEIYRQHIWKNCQITGGVDLGNFKDETDVNFPFGKLLLTHWEDCHIDEMSKTFHGDPNGPYGIEKTEVVTCAIGK